MKVETKLLEALNACEEAVTWAENFDTWEELWQSCERGDWMLWIVGRFAGEPGSEARKPLVLAACECARLALPYVKKESKTSNSGYIITCGKAVSTSDVTSVFGMDVEEGRAPHIWAFAAVI